VEGHASISADVLSRYAADAALGVPGVRRLVERALPYRRGVKLETNGEALKVELRLAVDWGASIPDVGREVQARVQEYLRRMADAHATEVDVVVDEVGAGA
jgi:uncharacterized alkaline shock family protein YloU